MINIYWLVIVALAVVSQWYIIEKKQRKPKKVVWFGIRIIIMAVFMFFYTKLGYDLVWSISFMAGTFFGPFNEGLNRFRHKPWGYLGDDWFDKIIGKALPDNLMVMSVEFLLLLWGVGSMLIYGIDTTWADLMGR